MGNSVTLAFVSFFSEKKALDTRSVVIKACLPAPMSPASNYSHVKHCSGVTRLETEAHMSDRRNIELRFLKYPGSSPCTLRFFSRGLVRLYMDVKDDSSLSPSRTLPTRAPWKILGSLPISAWKFSGGQSTTPYRNTTKRSALTGPGSASMARRDQHAIVPSKNSLKSPCSMYYFLFCSDHRDIAYHEGS